VGILALLILGVDAGWLVSRGATGASSLSAEIPVVDAVAKQQAGAFILDVRQPEEWNAFYIAGSTLIPLDQLASRLNELPNVKISRMLSSAVRDIGAPRDMTSYSMQASLRLRACLADSRSGKLPVIRR
jgi:hypothetical protein